MSTESTGAANTGTARVIDGKAFAEGLRARVGAAVAELARRHGLRPGLAVVLVGDDPASQVYVRNKAAKTAEAGMRAEMTGHLVLSTLHNNVAHRTPVLTSRHLDGLTGGRLFLKAESFQRTGSFKFRGAYNTIAALDDAARAPGVGTA